MTFGRPDPLIPAELQSLSGVAKQRLLNLRHRFELDLVHDDDRRATPYVPYPVQLTALNAMGQRILGPRTDSKEA